MDYCWEYSILIDGGKMSSIEGLDFRCCQQTSTIQAEVPSINQTLKTGAGDGRRTEGIFEATMK